MPKFFICTRFNIVTSGPGQQADRSGSPTGTVEWLAHRFDLFEKICLPSVMGQTDQDLVWFVFFSDRTPEPFLSRIREIEASYPPFKAVFLQDGEKQVRRYRSEVARSLTPADTHVITTRLDNDDALHKTYVQRMRAEFHGQDDEVVNFLNGVQYEMEAGIVVSLRKKSNPFIGRIEKVRNGQVDTVLGVMHYEAEEKCVLRDVDDPCPVWLQLIHSGNLLNRLNSSRIRLDLDLEREFAIEGHHIHKFRSIAHFLEERLLNRPWRRIKGAAGRLMRIK